MDLTLTRETNKVEKQMSLGRLSRTQKPVNNSVHILQHESITIKNISQGMRMNSVAAVSY